MFNDGGNDWDHANGKQNYRIHECGNFLVKHGNCERSYPPPTAPRLLIDKQVGSSSIEIAWNPPIDVTNVKEYKVWKNGSLLAVVPKSTLSFHDANLRAQKKYVYGVSVVNPHGIESTQEELTLKTLAPGKPGKPNFLTVAFHSPKSIRLKWTPPRDFGGAAVTSYRVYRKTLASKTGTTISTTISTSEPERGLIGNVFVSDKEAESFSWTDEDVKEGEQYEYSVRAMRLPRSMSGTFLKPKLQLRQSESELLHGINQEDNEGPDSDFVIASAVIMSRAPKLGDGLPHILVQGFTWDSWKCKEGWYNKMSKEAEILGDAGVDMVWFPPVSDAVDEQGYLPREWYKFDTEYGTESELRACLNTFLQNGISPVIDLVVNHRCASKTLNGLWTEFENPDWSHWAICENAKPGVSKSGEWLPRGGTGAPKHGDMCPYAPDLDHTNPTVQADVVKFVECLKSDLGFQAVRLDFAMGISPGMQKFYTEKFDHPFTVAEYWHGDAQVLRNYINATAGKIAVYDFPLYYTLKGCLHCNDFGGLRHAGMCQVDSVRAVTFLENHDTSHLEVVGGKFGSDDQISQGYAYILTHPGVPCVYWPHVFDFPKHMKDSILKICSVRKAAGVHSSSGVDIHQARGNLYAAVIRGKEKKVAMKMGHDDWHPGHPFPGPPAAWGNGFAVWIEK